MDGMVMETCGKCMGSGYGGHPDSGAVCADCNGQGGVRADLAQAPAPVRVKGLRWHNFDAWTHWAEGACGTYHVEERNGYWQVELRVGSLVHGVTETDGTTPPNLAAAKDAAQADYEARILAALEAPDAGLVAELVEALRLADAALSGANMNMKVVERKLKAALALIAHNTTEG